MENLKLVAEYYRKMAYCGDTYRSIKSGLEEGLGEISGIIGIWSDAESRVHSGVRAILLGGERAWYTDRINALEKAHSLLRDCPEKTDSDIDDELEVLQYIDEYYCELA